MSVSNRIPRPLQPLTRLESLEECLVAIDPRDGRPIGMASIAPTPGEPAVAAPWVTVREGLHRRGVATALLERLAVRARQHGHDRFRLQMVVSEQRMLELMRRVGVPCRPVRSLPRGGGRGPAVRRGRPGRRARRRPVGRRARRPAPDGAEGLNEPGRVGLVD